MFTTLHSKSTSSHIKGLFYANLFTIQTSFSRIRSDDHKTICSSRGWAELDLMKLKANLDLKVETIGRDHL